MRRIRNSDFFSVLLSPVTVLILISMEVGTGVESARLSGTAEGFPGKILSHLISQIIRLLIQAEIIKRLDRFLAAYIRTGGGQLKRFASPVKSGNLPFPLRRP